MLMQSVDIFYFLRRLLPIAVVVEQQIVETAQCHRELADMHRILIMIIT
jgi:hypothetical protein